MKNEVKVGDHVYDLGREHFVLHWGHSFKDVEHLFRLRQFTRLRSANFSGSDLDDAGLLRLSDYVELENLDLQDTQITVAGTGYLKQLKNLKYLRLKENPQLTNECIPNLIAIAHLQELQIHETSITEEGVQSLAILKHLRHLTLDVRKNNYTFDGLLKLSIAIPHCEILAKGDGVFCNGIFDGTWKH